MTEKLLLNGILCGLGAAMPIGPVNVEIARRTLRAGFSAGAAIGSGAVTVDVAYASLYCLGVQQFTRTPWVYWTLATAGVALLCFIGTSSLVAAIFPARTLALEPATQGWLRGGYVTGLLMTSTNPMTVAFWFSVLPALVGRFTEQPRRDLPIMCVGVFIGAMAWVAFFASALHLAGKFRKPWWLRAADGIGGTLMLGLAGVALWRAIRGPL